MNPQAPLPGLHSGLPGILADLGRWGMALTLVLGVHLGALAFYLRQRPEPVSSGEPVAAIMIELAPVAEAMATDETELSPDQEDSAASEASQEREPEPEELPEPVEEPIDEPVEEPVQAPVEEPLIEAPEAEVALAVARSPHPPRRPERSERPVRRDPPREPPRRQQQAAAPAAENRTRASSEAAQQSQRNAAAQSASGSGRAMSPARWQSRVMAHLERHKPRNASGRGQALVGFTIDTAGNVISARVVRSSGQPALDALALTVVQRASPVPAPPPGVNLTMSVAIEFGRR